MFNYENLYYTVTGCAQVQYFYLCADVYVCISLENLIKEFLMKYKFYEHKL
jgi:hypothetical protein